MHAQTSTTHSRTIATKTSKVVEFFELLDFHQVIVIR